jgi:DNA topoisomerase-1
MPKKLVIVESPSKAKTINKYLGKDYVVEATVGHLRNLPKSKLGVEIENNFLPQFLNIRGKGDIIKRLKDFSAKSDKIFIATDPDREGEAIAADIEELIRPKKKGEVFRVLFNEITKNGIIKGMNNPRQIDESLVASQRARRVMDRIIGYKMSPFLWKSIFTSASNNLSAGRVQSVALRLICEREEEIEAFLTTEYWSLMGEFETGGKERFHAKLHSVDGKEIKVPTKADLADELKKFSEHHLWVKDQAEAAALAKSIRELQEFKIVDISKRATRRNAPPPFITSTLQAEASKTLRFRARQTMQIAQKLYEGIEIGDDGLVGLITYMRTDSTRLSEEIVQDARGYIKETYGEPYLPAAPLVYDKKKGANVQDAHEAIRPTSLKYTPEYVRPYLDDYLFKLYQLVWKRFVACQMNPSITDTTIVEIAADKFLFKAYGQIVQFDGFTRIYSETIENDEQKEEDRAEARNATLPRDIKKNDPLALYELETHQHFTKPPARYTESSLIKELESKGIGRPSTYSLIVSTVIDRGYVTQEDRKLTPTSLGVKVNGVIVSNFPDIINIGFTAKMEGELDQIAQSENEYGVVLNDFYQPFVESLNRVEATIEKILCEKCGSEMAIKYGRFGRFLACTNYPECKNIKSMKELNNENTEPEYTGETCEVCGSRTVFRRGRFGKFIGCEKYPDCTYVKNITLGIPCPKCEKGEVTEKISKKRKAFFGCTNYPDCDFVSWQRPNMTACPNGDSKYMEEKYSKKKGKFLKCPVCGEEIVTEPVSEYEE